jgi:hypothetical protein
MSESGMSEDYPLSLTSEQLTEEVSAARTRAVDASERAMSLTDSRPITGRSSPEVSQESLDASKEAGDSWKAYWVLLQEEMRRANG